MPTMFPTVVTTSQRSKTATQPLPIPIHVPKNSTNVLMQLRNDIKSSGMDPKKLSGAINTFWEGFRKPGILAHILDFLGIGNDSANQKSVATLCAIKTYSDIIHDSDRDSDSDSAFITALQKIGIAPPHIRDVSLEEMTAEVTADLMRSNPGISIHLGDAKFTSLEQNPAEWALQGKVSLSKGLCQLKLPEIFKNFELPFIVRGEKGCIYPLDGEFLHKMMTVNTLYNALPKDKQITLQVNACLNKAAPEADLFAKEGWLSTVSPIPLDKIQQLKGFIEEPGSFTEKYKILLNAPSSLTTKIIESISEMRNVIYSAHTHAPDTIVIPPDTKFSHDKMPEEEILGNLMHDLHRAALSKTDIVVDEFAIPKKTLTLMESIAREIDESTIQYFNLYPDLSAAQKSRTEINSLNELGKLWAYALEPVLHCEKQMAFKIAAAIIYNSSQASMGSGTALLSKIGVKKTDNITNTYQNSLRIDTNTDEGIVIKKSESTVSMSDTKADIRVSKSGVEYVLPHLQEISYTDIGKKSQKYLQSSIDIKGFVKLSTI
ncbi:TPA: hypothetical protein PXM28_003950 [Yersinia enterocolitica]|nr:hypothetical protein [Yersinia enterocolitica]